jgi:hypothetical protein
MKVGLPALVSAMRSPSRLSLCLIFLAASALACSVPVFRYALEHWPADPFQVLVFHRGALTAELEQALTVVEATEGERPNVRVRRVDLDDQPPAELLRLFEQQLEARAPWLVVRFPTSSGILEPVVSAPLDKEILGRVLDSPARRELVRRLGEGQSAVWLLLESGDKEADDAAEKRLLERLDYLQGVMTLPKLDESDIANGLVSVPEEDLRLEFSLLRISRSDEAESMLVRQLLLSEDGLEEVEGEPMVFPVFGQGRALYALVGEGIRNETIESAAAFLIGKCSCQVKDQNPGVDLLMQADWTVAAKASPVLDRNLPTLEELLPVETVTTEAKLAQPSNAGLPRWALGAGVLLLVLAGLRLLRR